MTRILLVETASPKRVRRAAEEILRGGIYPDPEVTIFSTGNPEALRCFGEISGARVTAPRGRGTLAALGELRAERFDVVRIFWTGEAEYRWLKLGALRLGRRATLVDNGDGGLFPLTVPALLRHALFRLRHPLPADQGELAPPAREPRERILIVQSAEPAAVVRALARLSERPVFRDPRYTILCRNRPEVVKRFQEHPMIAEVCTHDRSRRALGHLRALRRLRFDGMVLCLTGGPSYWKIKYFAFLLGARHKLIFNENDDCFFFSWRDGLALLERRLAEQRTEVGETRSSVPLRLLLQPVKAALVPFRFAWLLVVWLRLRRAALRASGSRPAA